MSLLGIEVGVTRCRATAFSLEGDPLIEAQREYSIVSEPEGVRELDTRHVWTAVHSAISEVASQSRSDPISALSVSTSSEALVPLSSEGQILGRSILGSDMRGAHYADQLRSSLGAQQLFDITGDLPRASHSFSKLCWLRDNAPHLFDRTWRFVSLSGMVSHFLGGASHCDYSWASRTLLFDRTRETWSGAVLDACRMPIYKLPHLARAGSAIGTVSANLSRELGLPPGVRIILGGEDLCCQALGAGVVHSAMALYDLGSRIHAIPMFNAIPLTSLMLSSGLNLGHHVIPEIFLSVLSSSAGGNVLRWFCDNLAPLEKREAQRRGANVYDELLAEMPEVPTSLMMLPYSVPGAPAGFDGETAGAILGLQASTSRGEIIKALLEGVTYLFVLGQELLGQAGVRLETYRATGSGVRSQRWLQLTSDMLDRPLERTSLLSTGTLGVAILAGVGIDAYTGFEDAVQAAVHVQERLEPNPQRRAVYADKYRHYCELRSLLRDHLHHGDDILESSFSP